MGGITAKAGNSRRKLLNYILSGMLILLAAPWSVGTAGAVEVGGFVGVPVRYDLMGEPNCRRCHEDATIVEPTLAPLVPNRHHLLMQADVTIPPGTDAPFGVPGESYQCFSCHDLVGDPAFEIREFRNCVICHQQKPTQQNTVHHRSSVAQSGDCAHCHTIPAFAQERPPQAACRECHGAFMHENGGPIRDFGACVSCHNDSFGRAAAPILASSSMFPKFGVPRTFHAAPPRAVGYKVPAPGKGIFAIFWAQFTNNGQDQEDTFLEDITPNGDDVGDEGGFRWRRPSLNFNLVRIINNGMPYDVPAFPPLPTAPPVPSTGGDTPPVITYEAPMEGYSVSGTVGIKVRVSDDRAVKKVVYWVDQGSKLTMGGPNDSRSGSWTASWDSRYVYQGTQRFSILDGKHFLNIQAEDDQGKTSIKTISINVRNGTSYSGGYSGGDDDSSDD